MSAGARHASNTPLASLPNLGPKSQAMLAAVGITTLDQLREIGSVAAYVRVKQSGANASLNLLWALEGLLSGLPWQVVAREHRTSLLLAVDQAHAWSNDRAHTEPKSRNK